jgi:hypothetical protein
MREKEGVDFILVSPKQLTAFPQHIAHNSLFTAHLSHLTAAFPQLTAKPTDPKDVNTIFFCCRFSLALFWLIIMYHRYIFLI